MIEPDPFNITPGCTCVGIASALQTVLDTGTEPDPCAVHEADQHRARMTARARADADTERDRLVAIRRDVQHEQATKRTDRERVDREAAEQAALDALDPLVAVLTRATGASALDVMTVPEHTTPIGDDQALIAQVMSAIGQPVTATDTHR